MTQYSIIINLFIFPHSSWFASFKGIYIFQIVIIISCAYNYICFHCFHMTFSKMCDSISSVQALDGKPDGQAKKCNNPKINLNKYCMSYLWSRLMDGYMLITCKCYFVWMKSGIKLKPDWFRLTVYFWMASTPHSDQWRVCAQIYLLPRSCAGRVKTENMRNSAC